MGFDSDRFNNIFNNLYDWFNWVSQLGDNCNFIKFHFLNAYFINFNVYTYNQ